MSGKDYRDLVAWKKAFELALAIYRETRHFPTEEKYGILAQIRRASISVVSNIAEGQGRRSRSEFRHFLEIALGSLAELETQLLISNSLGYLSLNQAPELMRMAAEVGRLANGLINSLRNRRVPIYAGILLIMFCTGYWLLATDYWLLISLNHRPKHMIGKYNRYK